MSLPQVDQPFHDEEADRKRRAEIEGMMRWQREAYFRNEPVQQEYRDVIDRQEARREAAAREARGPGAFEVALQKFWERSADGNQSQESRVDLNEPPALFANELGPREKPRVVRVAQADVMRSQPATSMKESSPLNALTERFDALPQGGFDSEEKHFENSKRSTPRQSNVDVLLPEEPTLMRVAQSASSSMPSRAIEPTKLFVTDGANRVDQIQSKVAKTRKGPLSWELEDQLNYAAFKTGLRVEVHSGGQSRYGRHNIDWVGSHRHDGGDAGDVKLFTIDNGKKRYLNSNREIDRQQMQDFIRHAVIAGATGIGHGYMGPETIHMGGGDVLAWRNAEPHRPAFR